jgi:uncharacterized membrane protein
LPGRHAWLRWGSRLDHVVAMLSVNALQQLTTLVGTLVTLVGVITVLVRQIQQNEKIAEVHTNTNSALDQLRAHNVLLLSQQATAVQLQARPPMPPPAVP